MTRYPPVSPDPLKELANIRDVLFKVAAGLEEDKHGSAAMVVALMANRVNGVFLVIEQRSKADGTATEN